MAISVKAYQTQKPGVFFFQLRHGVVTIHKWGGSHNISSITDRGHVRGAVIIYGGGIVKKGERKFLVVANWEGGKKISVNAIFPFAPPPAPALHKGAFINYHQGGVANKW